MDKKSAIHIMTKAAKLFHENLEDNKLLFLYGIPSLIKKELIASKKMMSSMKYYEAAFHRGNFLHLTGVKINKKRIKSAIHFYEKSLANRLSEDDFFLARDGSSGQKLDIIEDMMYIKNTATMIGDFSDRGPRLYSEKVAGNICGCMGFVKDKNTSLNVPNTVLKKDIRDVTEKPINKIYAVFTKEYKDEKYCKIAKIDKEINMLECHFDEEIQLKLDMNAIRKCMPER